MESTKRQPATIKKTAARTKTTAKTKSPDKTKNMKQASLNLEKRDSSFVSNLKRAAVATAKFLTSRDGAILLLFATVIALALGQGCDRGHLSAMAVIAGTMGKKNIVSGEPLTLAITETASPDLLRNEIDERIVQIRPMSTPVDQISRIAGSRPCGSMIVDYYSIDTKPTSATVSGFSSSTKANNGFVTATIDTDNNDIFEPSETIMVPDVEATDADGAKSALVLYDLSRENTGIKAIAVNNVNESGNYVVPTIAVGSALVRMGRAAAELDVQTAQFESLPVKSQNYCQIFKTQVEQSTYQKIANKEVGWSFSDQEEAAIIDMRLGMEKNFIFGARNRVYDINKKEQIMLTGGIWNMAGNEFHYKKGSMTYDNLVEMSREAFTGNAGSSKKILIGGSRLIETLNKLDHQKVIGATETTTHWGLDFTEIVTKFGRLYVILSEVFDQCGHADDGLIIDPEYMTKYCHVPFRSERLDLRLSGQRNTDAIVITEASCLVLRYPSAHTRVIADDIALAETDKE